MVIIRYSPACVVNLALRSILSFVRLVVISIWTVNIKNDANRCDPFSWC